jgi:hypothetical protein
MTEQSEKQWGPPPRCRDSFLSGKEWVACCGANMLLQDSFEITG